MQDELGRKGDWLFPGRVDLFWQGAPQGAPRAAPQPSEVEHAEGVDAAPMVAVAAGRGLWAAVSARGEALLCIFPCLALVRVDGEALGLGHGHGHGGKAGEGEEGEEGAHDALVDVAVGREAAFLLTARGKVYGAATSDETGLRGAPLPVDPPREPPHLPRLGPLVLLGGALAAARVVQVVATPHACLAVSSDGEVFGWGLLWAGWGRPARTGAGVPPISVWVHHAPARAALPAGVRAVAVAAADTHWLLRTRDGSVLSASLPTARRASVARAAAVAAPLGRPGAHFALSRVRLDSAGEAAPGAGATSVAAGDAFSLVLLSSGAARRGGAGALLYWDHRAPGARAAALPSTSPSPIGAWHRSFRKARFLAVSACARHVLVLSEAGELYSWLHGRETPQRVDSVRGMAVTALAAGETVGLLLSPAYDLRSRHAYAAGVPRAPRAPRLLAEPAPFPRAVVTRGDNIGIHELLKARPDAMSAAHDGLDPRYVRTPCWRPGARGARCPLARPADCAEWFPAPASGAAAAAAGALRCLPAVLLLGARGCGVSRLAALLGRHPDVTVAGQRAAGGAAAGGPAAVGRGAATHVRPWWSHASLDSFDAAVRGSVGAVEARPSRQLLVQWSTLGRDSVGLGAALWDANVSLAELLPRVQPGLRIVLLLCDPLERLQALRPPPRPARLARQRLAYEACARRAPAAACVRDSDGGAPLLEGAYSLWVRELLRALPAEQIRVVLAEDLQRRPAVVLAELHGFLGLTPSRGRERDPDPDPSALWARPAARAVPLPAATRTGLREFYAGFNEELAHFMDGDPRFLWHER